MGCKHGDMRASVACGAELRQLTSRPTHDADPWGPDLAPEHVRVTLAQRGTICGRDVEIRAAAHQKERYEFHFRELASLCLLCFLR